MNLSQTVALAVLAASLAAAPAQGAPTEEQKRLAAMAADPTASKKAPSTAGRLDPQAERAARVKLQAGDFERLCRIKPVMTDAEIESCKRAYRL